MKRKNIFCGLFLLFVFITGFELCNLPVKADAAKGDYFISFGADLTEKEKKQVCENLGINEEDVLFSKTIKVTNAEEHQYLDSYVSSKAIGKRALSSVYIEKAEKGSGIQIETSHITYCTSDMYKSALTTAGLTDVKVKITGPYDISGTAALVGTMKAYENMSHEEISEETKDAVNDELTTTKELAESVGEDKAQDIIMKVKERVSEKENLNPDDLQKIVEDVCEEENVELSEEEIGQIRRLAQKFDDLNIDINSVISQAEDIYHGLAEHPIRETIGEKIINFFKRIFENFQS